MSSRPHTLTLITYNIHHARGLDRRVNVPRIGTVLKDSEADVACLQEVDSRVLRSRCSNQPRELARQLEMKEVYGPTLTWPLGARYGNLVLTRLPLLSTHTHLLPSDDEQRGLIETHLETAAGPIAVFCTHWGLSAEERIRQAKATVEIVRGTGVPCLLAGDFNEDDTGGAHAVLRDAGLIPLGPPDATYPAAAPSDRIDHVYGSPDWRATDGYTIPSLASDHRPVVVELRLGAAR